MMAAKPLFYFGKALAPKKIAERVRNVQNLTEEKGIILINNRILHPEKYNFDIRNNVSMSL